MIVYPKHIATDFAKEPRRFERKAPLREPRKVPVGAEDSTRQGSSAQKYVMYCN